MERLTLFSDAVVAIAIALLAADLPVPEGDTVSAFWSSVRRNDGHYAAFLISFFVIAAAWSDHHDLFRYTTRADPRLRTLNMTWLLAIVLVPFATRMLTASGHPALDVHALRFGFYALLQVLEAGALLAMLRHMVSRGQAPGAPRPVVTGMARQCHVLMAGFGLSVPLFFVTTDAWLLWVIVPLLAGQVAPAAPPGRPWPRGRAGGGLNPHYGKALTFVDGLPAARPTRLTCSPRCASTKIRDVADRLSGAGSRSRCGPRLCGRDRRASERGPRGPAGYR